MGIYVKWHAEFSQVISFSLKYDEMAKIQDGRQFYVQNGNTGWANRISLLGHQIIS